MDHETERRMAELERLRAVRARLTRVIKRHQQWLWVRKRADERRAERAAEQAAEEAAMERTNAALWPAAAVRPQGCDIEGCGERATAGTPSDGPYLLLCAAHGAEAFAGRPREVAIRPHALWREGHRSVHRVLPPGRDWEAEYEAAMRGVDAPGETP